MEFAPNVYRAVVGHKHNNVYLIEGSRSAAFFDSGFDNDDSLSVLLRLWEDAGEPDVSHVVISHRHIDHSGGASDLAKAVGATIISTPVEKDPIETANQGTKVGRTVRDGETIELGGLTIEFVHTPGHTVGSLSAYYKQENVLFAGDTIRTSEPFKYDPEAGDLGLHIQSLRKLQGYDIRMIGPGHGPPVNDPVDFIQNEIAVLGSVQGESTG